MQAIVIIANALLLLIVPILGQCQVGSQYHFVREGHPEIQLGEKMSELRKVAGTEDLKFLRENRSSANDWKSITVDYDGLEISYWEESDAIYYLWSTVEDWRVSDKLQLGAVFNTANYAQLDVVRTKSRYWLPYCVQVRERKDLAYCMVGVTDQMVIKELSLSFAGD